MATTPTVPPATTATPTPTPTPASAAGSWRVQLALDHLDTIAAAERDNHVAAVATRITAAYHAEQLPTDTPEVAEEIRAQAEVVAMLDRLDGFHAELAARTPDPELLAAARTQPDEALCGWRYAAVRLADQRPVDLAALLAAAQHDHRQATRERASHTRALAAANRQLRQHNPSGSPLAALERWACRLAHRAERARLAGHAADLARLLTVADERAAALAGMVTAAELRQGDRLAWYADHTPTLAHATAAIHVLAERGHTRFVLDRPCGWDFTNDDAGHEDPGRDGRPSDDTQPIPIIPAPAEPATPDQAAS